MIKIISFDFDGVLVDSFDMAFSINKKADSKLTKEEFAKGFEGNFYEQKISNISLKNFVKEYFELGKNQAIDKKTCEELRNLSGEYKLVIVTSNLNFIVEAVLCHNNILKLFSKIYGADIERSKTKKFEILFKDFNINPDECVFVADTLGDILEAKEAGAETLAYIGQGAYHSKEILERGNPKGFIKDISEIKLMVAN